jgi:PAS domain S-box-containing protein/putative nucleotidyltransferase with HDIG domain
MSRALDTPSAPPPAPASILVVNDNAAQRLAISVMLAPLDLAIVEADSGRAALRAVLDSTYAVILMDVRMPVLDGYETARLIRERGGADLTPIIFFTAYGRDDTETLTAYASGAVDFIFTPVRPEVLRAKVSAFTTLFSQKRELQRSVDSVSALNGALRESEARARTVLQNVADGIVMADEHGVIESFNASAQRRFGYDEAAVCGQLLELLVATDQRDAVAAARAALPCTVSGGELPAQTMETVGRCQDGSTFPMELSLSRMALGERTLLVGCIRDISARKEQADREEQRTQALRREAQRDRVTFEEAPIGSLITGRDGLIERVNQEICRMTGRTPQELVGTHHSTLAHPEDRDHTTNAIAALLDGNVDSLRYEKRFLHRSGHVIEGRVALTAIRDEAREVVQFFAQIEDVTEARRTTRALEQAQFEMLARLAAAAEFRDDDTGQHTRRVGDLSFAIAERLGLPAAQLELIRLAAPLHDVGKIAIPDSVLGKPGKLTADEFTLMKTHTTVGAKMLTGSGFALLDVAGQIALTHHERWDGTGYPAGLAGDAIPIAGRIVAVADVFDALTHARPYKIAWTAADATAEMRTQSGRQFDPQVLTAFLSLDRAATVSEAAPPASPGADVTASGPTAALHSV